MTLLYTLLVILFVQQVLDVWTTKTALDTGRAREANGPLSRLMNTVGVMPALLGTKVLFGGLVAFTVEDTVAWHLVLVALVLLYAWVLTNNFRVLRKLGEL